MIKAKWKKGKKIITGSYEYIWSGDFFWVILDKKNPITGEEVVIKTYDDNVSFNGWKKVKTNGR